MTAAPVLDTFPDSRPPGLGPGPLHLGSVQGTLALQFDRPRSRRFGVILGGRRELDAFAARFAQAVVEVIGGDRGPSQLLRCTTEEVYADLVHRASVLQRTLPSDRRVRRLRAQVHSVHLFCPSPEAAELSIHVRQGERSRAIAARLQQVEGRWCCVALEFG